MSLLYIGLPKSRVTPDQQERIKALAPGFQIIITDQPDEIEPVLDQVEIAAGHFPPEWINQAPKLRWYQQWGAGADWLMKHPEIQQRDFILTNASGVHSIPITEHILALMLAFTRRLQQAFRDQQNRRWSEIDSPEELAGKTLLLIGVGAIGRHTARVASLLGMHVIGITRRSGKPSAGVERLVTQEHLLEELRGADFVVLTIPLTRDTRHLIDANAIKQMKTGAYIINIGRGATIDEAALAQALKEGKIAGAGLDVFEQEPLPAGSPLWAMQNVIITAHYSGNTPFYDQRALDIFLTNLECFTRDKPMRNVVDKHQGY